jgi:anti-anti-sigma regulatory factor
VTRWHAIEWQTEVDAASGVRIYHVTGLLSDSHQSMELVDQVRNALRSDARPVLLDLTEAAPLNSTGVGIVAAIYTSAVSARTVLALAGVGTRTRLILRLVHLLDLICTFGDSREALAAYARGGWVVTP